MVEKRKREERDKVVGKREKGMVSTFPFLEGHLLLASQTFFPTSLEIKKKRGNEGWGDEGEGKREERDNSEGWAQAIT